MLHEIKANELDPRSNNVIIPQKKALKIGISDYFIVFSICHVDSGKPGLDSKPESCVLRGTIRSFDAKTKEFLVARIKEVAQGIG